MGEIFRRNIDADLERLIITNLTNDLIDVYQNFTNCFLFQFLITINDLTEYGEEENGREYSKFNGEQYLFDPPRKELFEGNGLPIFLSTPKKLTKMIMSVEHIDDYKTIMNYMLSERNRYPGQDSTCDLEEDPVDDSVIFQTFNRDLVYCNNMQKLKSNLKIHVYNEYVVYLLISFLPSTLNRIVEN